MTTNFTLLALNLLISERIEHRRSFANQMSELLRQNTDGAAQDKSNFLTAIAQCVENPKSEAREELYKFAMHYSQKANAQANLSTAA